MLRQIFAILLAASLLPISMVHVYAEESCKGLVKVGDRVGIKSQVTNSQVVKGPIAVILQIKDSSDVTVQLSWLVGILEPNQKMDVIQSWLPEHIGQYKAEVFVWYSVDNPEPLSPVQQLAINVNC